MEQQSTQTAATSIHPATHIGLVTMRVADLERSLEFYEGILRFKTIERAPGRVVLGANDNVPLLELQELPGAPFQSRRLTGLYHVAILLPSRADLGQELTRMATAGLDIGQADHLVSEALYITDPDGNGLEIYRDRPRDEWNWSNGQIQMASDPLDLQAIMEEGTTTPAWDTLPAGTRVGHIHLRVADIPQSEHFYHDILGFDIIARMPSALFISAGGYHHHIGMNTWESRGAGPTPDTMAGLQSYVIALANREALNEVRARLQSNNVPFEEHENEINVSDPWQNRIQLVAESA